MADRRGATRRRTRGSVQSTIGDATVGDDTVVELAERLERGPA